MTKQQCGNTPNACIKGKEGRNDRSKSLRGKKISVKATVEEAPLAEKRTPTRTRTLCTQAHTAKKKKKRHTDLLR